MDVRKACAGGAALISLALAGMVAAPAFAQPMVTVGSLSSLQAGARVATLHGRVVNRTNHEAAARVVVRIQRYGAKARIVGRTAVHVAGNASARYRVRVSIPAGLKRGNYYLSACTPSGLNTGALGCATSHRDLKIKGGTAIRGALVKLPARASRAHAAQAEVCSPGAHTLVKPGDRV